MIEEEEGVTEEELNRVFPVYEFMEEEGSRDMAAGSRDVAAGSRDVAAGSRGVAAGSRDVAAG